MRFIRSSVYVPRRSVVAFGPSSRLAHRRLPLRAFVLGGLALILLAFAGPSWSQTLLGADIDGEAAFDNSGSSVSLSSDGTRVAIGALFNVSNGSTSGHVRVYRFASVSSAPTPVPSVPSAPTPVPTLPLFGLGILASLLGLFGLRRLRQ